MPTCIALLRGVNVGRSRRIAMSELRKVFESLGHAKVRTLLAAGNVVFDAKDRDTDRLRCALEKAIEAQFGFKAPVMVLTAVELATIVESNPLPRAAKDPARYLVAVAPNAATLAKAKDLLAQRWAPEAIAFGQRAAYLWCADGLIESRIWKAFERATENAATARNWATILKLHEAARAGSVKEGG
jgi:uncharacterized protein (DUF1697 family)